MVCVLRQTHLLTYLDWSSTASVCRLHVDWWCSAADKMSPAAAAAAADASNNHIYDRSQRLSFPTEFQPALSDGDVVRWNFRWKNQEDFVKFSKLGHLAHSWNRPVWEQTRIFWKLNSFHLLSACFQTIAIEIEYWRRSRIITIIGLRHHDPVCTVAASGPIWS